jgi:Uma2 family endonuclease
MATPAVHLYTWDDIKNLPESAGRTEIVDGDLIISPSPGGSHQRICTELGIEVGAFIRKAKIGTFYSSAFHVILDMHVHYEPDLCFVVKDRLNIIQENYIDGPPDLIIEVISEGNRTHDTVVKFAHYEKYGVKEYWLIDQRDRLISIYGLRGNKYGKLGAFAPGDSVRSEILAGLDFHPASVLLDL